MAIIKQEKIFIDGAEFVRKVKCGGSGIMTIEMPPGVKEIMGGEVVEGTTMAAVLNEWERVIHEYEQAQTSRRKIIAYKIQTDGDLSFHEGRVLSIWACIYIEVKTVRKNGKDYINYDCVPYDENLPGGFHNSDFNVSMHDSSGVKIIDWTPERQKFFESVHMALDRLISKLNKYFSEDNFLLNIDSGRLISESISISNKEDVIERENQDE